MYFIFEWGNTFLHRKISRKIYIWRFIWECLECFVWWACSRRQFIVVWRYDFYLHMQRIKQQIHEITSIQAMSTKIPIPQGLWRNATTSHSMNKNLFYYSCRWINYCFAYSNQLHRCMVVVPSIVCLGW